MQFYVTENVLYNFICSGETQVPSDIFPQELEKRVDKPCYSSI